jgi:hypothetical protein
VHRRHFFHLRCLDNTPATWRRTEPFPSVAAHGEQIEFEFFWVPLPSEVPPLIADHGAMLAALWRRLSGFTSDGVDRRSLP